MTSTRNRRLPWALASSLAWALALPAGAQTDPEPACFSDQPIVTTQRLARLTVVATSGDGGPDAAAPSISWRVDAGRLLNNGASASWDLSDIRSEALQAVAVTAVATLRHADGRQQTCTVRAFVHSTAQPEIIDRGDGADRLTRARQFLVRGTNSDAAGYYGKYTYLLLRHAPQGTEETDRYLQVIEALLSLAEKTVYLAMDVRPRSMNVTFIPVTSLPATPAGGPIDAKQVLARYDYEWGRRMADRTDVGVESGPFLVSMSAPVSDARARVDLQQDLSSTVPRQARRWVETFGYLSIQERDWSRDKLHAFGLKLRNVIAVGGKVVGEPTLRLVNAIRTID